MGEPLSRERLLPAATLVAVMRVVSGLYLYVGHIGNERILDIVARQIGYYIPFNDLSHACIRSSSNS